jgi:hypothetical protein
VRGFNSWKHAFGANQGFLKHQNSQCHKIADTTVLQVMDKSRNELIKHNREKLIKIASTLHLCARQMIAIRGHEEGES